MSYYTAFSLDVNGMKSEKDYNEVSQWLKDRDIINYALYEDGYIPTSSTQYFSCSEPVNWFTSNEDMIELSKAFPQFVFRLNGDGEVSDDMWDHYYQNGEDELCLVELNFPEPTKIKWV